MFKQTNFRFLISDSLRPTRDKTLTCTSRKWSLPNVIIIILSENNKRNTSITLLRLKGVRDRIALNLAGYRVWVGQNEQQSSRNRINKKRIKKVKLRLPSR